MPTPPKQPQDHKPPQDAQDDVPKGLTWVSKSGATLTLPPIGSVPTGVWREVRRMDDMDATLTMLEHVLDADGLATLDKLPLTEVNDLFAQWQAAAGASPGESSSSST
jgi:hypothetical protein